MSCLFQHPPLCKLGPSATPAGKGSDVDVFVMDAPPALPAVCELLALAAKVCIVAVLLPSYMRSLMTLSVWCYMVCSILHQVAT